jgi:hypothetical protein
MGQQQLLLIVLSTVIVGIAIVAGINMFSEGSTQNARLQMENQLMDVAGKANIWRTKPAAMGGGGGSFLNITTGALSITPDSTVVDSISFDGSAGTSVDIVVVGSVDGNGDGTPMKVIATMDQTGEFTIPPTFTD